MLVFLSFLIAGIGSLPLILRGEPIWSIVTWAVSLSVLATAYRWYDAKKLKFVHADDRGVGLQLKRETDTRRLDGTK